MLVTIFINGKGLPLELRFSSIVLKKKKRERKNMRSHDVSALGYRERQLRAVRSLLTN